MGSLQDHPVIQNMLLTGSPSGKVLVHPICPICPICGAEIDKAYVQDRYGDVVGCPECVSLCDAWKCYECFQEED